MVLGRAASPALSPSHSQAKKRSRTGPLYTVPVGRVEPGPTDGSVSAMDVAHRAFKDVADAFGAHRFGFRGAGSMI